MNSRVRDAVGTTIMHSFVPQPLVIIGILDQTTTNRVHDDVFLIFVEFAVTRHAIERLVQPHSSALFQSFVDFVS